MGLTGVRNHPRQCFLAGVVCQTSALSSIPQTTSKPCPVMILYLDLHAQKQWHQYGTQHSTIGFACSKAMASIWNATLYQFLVLCRHRTSSFNFEPLFNARTSNCPSCQLRRWTCLKKMFWLKPKLFDVWADIFWGNEKKGLVDNHGQNHAPKTASVRCLMAKPLENVGPEWGGKLFWKSDSNHQLPSF